MKKEIVIESIARETEKAILVEAKVSYNDNLPKARTFWMPKSLVEMCEDSRLLKVEDWFLKKLSFENAFHGYHMEFNTWSMVIA